MIGALTSALNSASNSLSTSLNRLGTGSRLNSAKDDAAGLAIAALTSAQISSSAVALNNIGDGISITQTASGGLGQVSEALQQMRQLAVQSVNGTNSTSDRQALQAQFSQLSSGLDSISSQAQFNGQNLLDGTFSKTLQTGPNAGDTQDISLGSVSSATLGIAPLDISTSAGSSSALSAIDQAIDSISSQQAAVGATQSSLEATSSRLTASSINLSSSRSAIADTDYAAESSSLTLARIKQQSSLKAIALYNANQASLISLLPGQSR